jgi:hypothetical protein
MSDPKVREMLWYQKAINDKAENRLCLLFSRRWYGQIRVKIAYTTISGREHIFDLDLDSAYWYVCGMADALGAGSPLSKRP